MILETAYPYTLDNADAYPNIFGKDSAIDGYPISIEGQRSFLIDLTQKYDRCRGKRCYVLGTGMDYIGYERLVGSGIRMG